MPLRPGMSPEIVSSNIKEMVRNGYKPRQAVAAALAKKRKYGKMNYAEGGEVEEEMLKGPGNYQRTLGEIAEQGDSHPQDISNPAELDDDMDIAEGLRRQAQADFGTEHYAMGGLVEGEMDGEMGNKPSEEMEDATEEPMSSELMKPSAEYMGGLSEKAKMALEMNKKMRRYK